MTVPAKMVIPKGIYTPIITFFNEDDSLDLDTQIEHAKFLYGRGINGLVVAGSMGESAHLSREERNKLVSGIRLAIPDENFKIIAGAPPMGNIEETLIESRLAAESGADFIILLVPGYFGPNLISQQGIVDYFTKVANNSALPVIIYNYPGTCNAVTISIDSYHKLASVPNIVGVKLTHFNLDQYALLGKNVAICEEDNFRPFTGLGQVLIPSLSVGIYGAIDGLSAIFPKVMVKLFNLFHEGNLAEASQLQYLVTKADMMIMKLNVVGVKHALKEIHGFGSSTHARPPLGSLDVKEYEEFIEDLNVLQKLENSI